MPASSNEILCIEQIQHPDRLLYWLPQLRQLITAWLDILQEDSQAPLDDAEILYANFRELLPFVWIAYNKNHRLAVGASLTNILPDRYAYIHGARALEYRKHPAIRHLSSLVLDAAFSTLGLYKLKAEFEADNQGALGFCRIYGFSKEAHFKEDNLIQGQRKDVVVYSLFSPTYVELKRQRRL